MDLECLHALDLLHEAACWEELRYDEDVHLRVLVLLQLFGVDFFQAILNLISFNFFQCDYRLLDVSPDLARIDVIRETAHFPPDILEECGFEEYLLLNFSVPS